MKLKFLHGFSEDSDAKVTSVDTYDLDLCGQGRAEGNASGLMPVKLPGGVVVTPMVTVTSATSTTKRSSRSAVIKVSMPYSAVTTDDGGNVVPDPNRSGADISIHLVVALPAAATKDIQGLNGTYAKYGAESQTALLYTILRTVIGSQFGGTPVIQQNESASPTFITTSAAFSAPQVGAQSPSPDANSAIIAAPTVGGYVGTGFDVSSFRLPQRLDSFLARVANGLPMLSCGDTEVEPLAVYIP